MSTHEHRPTNEAVHKLCGDVFIAGTEVAKVQGLYGAGQDFIKDSFSGNVRGMGPAVAELGSALLGIAGVAANGHANCFFSVLFLRKSSGNTDSDDVPGWNAFDQPNAAPRGPPCVGNDGIDWRGTHYPLRQPRADQRDKFFRGCVSTCEIFLPWTVQKKYSE